MLANRMREAAGGSARPNPFDDLDSIFALHGMRRMHSNWAGNLVRVRRGSDSAEGDFGFDGSGALDISSLVSWLGGAAAYVVRVYDQSGNGRDLYQSNAGLQPELVLFGNPFARFDGAGDSMELISGSAFAQNQAAVSIVGVKAWRSTPTNCICIAASVNGAVNTVRAGLMYAGFTTPNGFLAAGRRLDADSIDYAGPILEGDTSWHVHVGRFDYANSDAFLSVGANNAYKTNFQTTGTTSNTPSARIGVGGMSAAHPPIDVNVVAWLRDMLTDDETSRLIVSLASMLN